MSHIHLAVSDDAIRACFPVMQQLRPHLTDAEEFLTRVRRQQAVADWRLVYAEHNGQVAACAGFRVHEWLVSGKVLYVDDLVTDEAHRSLGLGKALLDWLKALAKTEGCPQLHLDSGTHRKRAHAFYFREGLLINDFHFSCPL